MPELFRIPGPSTDEGRGDLNALFRAQLLLERRERRRRVCGWFVILVSVPMALLVFRRAGLDDPRARFVILLWAFSFIGWGTTSAAVLMVSRAVDRIIAKAGGRRIATPNDDE